MSLPDKVIAERRHSGPQNKNLRYKKSLVVRSGVFREVLGRRCVLAFGCALGPGWALGVGWDLGFGCALVFGFALSSFSFGLRGLRFFGGM